MLEQNISWLYAVGKCLPELMSKLLDQGIGESLERLQLVEISVRLLNPSCVDSAGRLIGSGIERSGERDKFLILSGHMINEVGPWFDIAIKYFVRGERKFFRTESMPSVSAKHWCAFNEKDINNFLGSLGQENSFFTSRALARLNGRTEIQVPSQMLMLLGWQEMLRLWPKAHQPLSKLNAQFLISINVGEPLGISSLLSDVGIEVTIVAEHGPALALQAS